MSATIEVYRDFPLQVIQLKSLLGRAENCISAIAIMQSELSSSLMTGRGAYLQNRIVNVGKELGYIAEQIMEIQCNNRTDRSRMVAGTDLTG